MNEKYFRPETLSPPKPQEKDANGDIGQPITRNHEFAKTHEKMDKILILTAARKAYPLLVHELGHYMLIKFIEKETPPESRIPFIAVNIEIKTNQRVDPETGSTLWDYDIIAHNAITSFSLERRALRGRPGKLIAAAGFAALRILGLDETELGETEKDYSHRDVTNFKNAEEMEYYVREAIKMLEPETDRLKRAAKRLSLDVAKNGTGHYQLDETHIEECLPINPEKTYPE